MSSSAVISSKTIHDLFGKQTGWYMALDLKSSWKIPRKEKETCKDTDEAERKDNEAECGKKQGNEKRNTGSKTSTPSKTFIKSENIRDIFGENTKWFLTLDLSKSYRIPLKRKRLSDQISLLSNSKRVKIDSPNTTVTDKSVLKDVKTHVNNVLFTDQVGCKKVKLGMLGRVRKWLQTFNTKRSWRMLLRKRK